MGETVKEALEAGKVIVLGIICAPFWILGHLFVRLGMLLLTIIGAAA